MTTMSDEGERTCPLCAEEMDLTDQQLKPCKCGYEICVWCWHHIIDMAEKDDTEGRCPACRAPYNKERIVGMTSNCERVVAEMNAERKQKSQKAKPRTSAEARKHLSCVRVIQRNLVYIIGLPSNLADESMLERREYFGQYGNVLKVSLSRPASGAQQASNGNTFSVYITYTKEEEAVRCIQAVHNFVLEGKPLRACFGTTKYCHAWLRNMTCSNPDCLYLHDIGTQEDSFTKDEIISAYTRSRVPQLALNNLQRRSGNVLPPAADDFNLSGTASSCKPVVKSSSYICSSQDKASAVNGSGAGRSTVLPAASSWGLRASKSQPPVSSTACIQGPAKQKAETLSNLTILSSTVSSTKHTSAWYDDVVAASNIPEESHLMPIGGRSRPLEPSKLSTVRGSRTTSSNQSAEVAHTTLTSAWDDVITTSKISEESYPVHLNGRTRSLEPSTLSIDREFQTTSSNWPAETAHTKETSVWHDDIVSTSKTREESHITQLSGRCTPSEPSKLCNGRESPTAVSDLSADIVLDAAHHTSGTSSSPLSSPPASEDKDRDLIGPGINKIPANDVFPERLNRQSPDAFPDKITHGSTAVNKNIQSLCSGLSSVVIDRHSGVGHLTMDEDYSSVSHSGLTGLPRNSLSGLQQFHTEKPSLALTKASEDTQVSRDLSSWISEPQKQGLSHTGADVLVSNDDRRHRLSGAVTLSSYMPYSSQSLNVSNDSSSHPWSNVLGSSYLPANGYLRTMDTKSCEEVLPFSEKDPVLPNGYKEGKFGSSAELGKIFERPDIISRDAMKCIGRLSDISNNEKTASVDMGENNIISNILSMDFDPWDDSPTSANNFVKLLGETDRQNGSLKMPSPWKLQNSMQSRFSFARQENQAYVIEPSFSEIGHAHNSTSQDSLGGGFQNGFTSRSFEDPIGCTDSSHKFLSSDNTSAVSRAKITGPPGFLAPNRAPPPGFSSQYKLDQTYDTTPSENHLLGHSLLRNQYQVPLTGNTVDVEFIDPAILAVGKGKLPLGVNNSGLGLRSFPTPFHISESDPRLQMYMQQSVSAHHDLRIPDHIGDRYLPYNDAYIPSRLTGQNHSSLSPFAQISLQQSSNSHISNSLWAGRNDIQTGNDTSMAGVLRTERLGINKYFPGNEELKFSIPGNLYNRTFEM